MTVADGTAPEPGNSGGDLAESAKTRADLYGFLGELFRREIDGDRYAALTQAPLADALNGLGIDLSAAFGDQPVPEIVESLAIEYTRLFVGPGKHVAPFGSVHLGQETGSLWGEEAVEVGRFLSQHGLAPADDLRLPPDHVCVELEVMRTLATREADAWWADDHDEAVTCRRHQRTFLQAHLGRWFPAFAAKVRDWAKLPVYAQITTLAEDFLKQDLIDLRTPLPPAQTP